MMVCETMNSEFGAELKRLRKQARMSLDELATAADMSKTYLANIENNKPHPISGALPEPSREIVTKLAIALDWKLADAFLLAGYAPPRTPADVLSRFPTAHSISNGEDVLARRVNGEIVTESNMDRAEKMLMRAGVLQEEAKQLQIDALRIIKGANQEE